MIAGCRFALCVPESIYPKCCYEQPHFSPFPLIPPSFDLPHDFLGALWQTLTSAIWPGTVAGPASEGEAQHVRIPKEFRSSVSCNGRPHLSSRVSGVIEGGSQTTMAGISYCRWTAVSGGCRQETSPSRHNAPIASRQSATCRTKLFWVQDLPAVHYFCCCC